MRAARADAWASYYKMLMLTADEDIRASARSVLGLTRDMKYSRTADEVDRKSNEVHDAVDRFARKCLPQVTLADNRRKRL